MDGPISKVATRQAANKVLVTLKRELRKHGIDIEMTLDRRDDALAEKLVRKIQRQEEQEERARQKRASRYGADNNWAELDPEGEENDNLPREGAGVNEGEDYEEDDDDEEEDEQHEVMAELAEADNMEGRCGTMRIADWE